MKNINIGVDTKLANSCKDLIKLCSSYYKNIVFMKTEGVRSCYIDCVDRIISPSSYCTKYRPLDSKFIGISKQSVAEYNKK